MLYQRIRQIRFSLKQVVGGVLVVISAAILALVVWGLNKGFDIKDESYYLLGYQAGQEKFFDVSAFHLLVISRLFGFLNNVIAYRVLSVLVTLLAAAAFSLGFVRMLATLFHPARRLMNPWIVGVGFTGASFFWAAGLTLTFSYNVLINATMLAVSGVLLFLIPQAGTPRAGRRVVGWGMLIGLILGVSVLVKPPSTLLIALCALALLLVCWLPRHARLALIWVASVAAGGLVGLAGALFGLGIWGDFYKSFTIGQLLSNNHVSLDLIKNSLVELLPMLQLVYQYSWILVIIFFVGLFSACANLSPRVKQVSIAALVGWLVVYLVSGTSFESEFISGNLARMPLVGFFLLALCILLEVIGLNRVLRSPQAGAVEPVEGRPVFVQKAAFGLYLLILPFATAFGTNNPQLWQVWMHITPWCALAVLFLQEIEQVPYFRHTAWLVFLLLVVWLGARWSNIYLKYPYRLVQNRMQQTETFPIDIPSLRGLKVDPPTQKFFSELKIVADRSHLQNGDELIQSVQSPGLVLALGGFSPGTPWLYATASQGCTPVIYSQLDPRRASFILSTDLPPDFIACLKQQGMDFPSDYVETGQVQDPYIGGIITFYTRKD
jgi:hypothetical protein